MGAAYFVDSRYKWELLKWKPRKESSGEIFTNFGHWLKYTLRNEKIDVLVVEKGHISPYFAAAKIIFGLMAVCEAEAFGASVPTRFVSPTTVKKFWTGSGKAKKEEMVEVTRKRVGVIENHNVSDAIALLNYWINEGHKKETK